MPSFSKHCLPVNKYRQSSFSMVVWDQKKCLYKIIKLYKFILLISAKKLQLLSHISCVRLCVTPETATHRLPRPWDSPGKNTGVGCHFLLQCMKVKSESEVAQTCPTLSDPIFQARVLEWGAIAFSKENKKIVS